MTEGSRNAFSLWGFWLAVALLLLAPPEPARAVSGLAPGDIAVLGFNSDGGDDFSFLALDAIDGGVVIDFTDGEGTVRYTTPPAGLPAGRVVAVVGPSTASPSATTGTVTKIGSFNLNSDGDALEVRQGSSYLYAAETLASYAAPPGLSAAGYTVVSHPNATDNGRHYVTALHTGTRDVLLASIADTGLNWEYSDGVGDQSMTLTSPYDAAFTIPGDSSGSSWSSTVWDGWICLASRPGTLVSKTVVGYVRTDNNDAASAAACYSRPGATIAFKTWFSVYFTNSFPAGANITSAQLICQHQGLAGTSGTMAICLSTNRSQTLWYANGAGAAHLTGPDATWNATEQSYVLDVTSALTSAPRVNNCEFLVLNKAAAGNVYFDYFQLNVTYTPFAPPDVSNDGGATNATENSASLRGVIAGGAPQPAVYLCWGDQDGGTATSAWDHVEYLGVRRPRPTPFYVNVSGLTANQTYYYRCYATNAAGADWANATTNFSTLPPAVQFGQAATNGDESAAAPVLPLVLSTPSAVPVTVQYAATGGTAANGADYSSASGTATIPAFASTGGVALAILEDALDEPDETVAVGLSSPSNARIGALSNCTYSIRDNDAPPTVTFTNQPFSAREDAGNLAVSLNLGAPSGKDVSVTVSTSNGTALAAADYTARTGTVTWTAGQTGVKTFLVPIINDADPEASETLGVLLSAPVNASLGGALQALATIEDNDYGPPILENLAATGVSSNAATLRGRLISEGGMPSKAWFYWGLADGGTNRAAWGHVESVGSVVRGTFSRGISGLSEHTTYYYRCFASNALGTSWAPATSTLLTGPPTVQFSTITSQGAESLTPALVSVRLYNPSVYAHDVAADYILTGGTASAGTDYSLAPGRVTIPAGSSSVNISMSVVSDAMDEYDETVLLRLTASLRAGLGSRTNHTYTIADDDAAPAVAFSGSPYSVSEGAGSRTITVTLSAASGKDVSISYLTSDGTARAGVDYTGTGGSLAWPAGQTGSRTFSVPILNNARSEGDRTFSVTLYNPINCRITGGSVAPVAIIEDELTPPAINNGGGAMDVGARDATARGEVTAGVYTPDTYIYWGASDGGTVKSAWGNCIPMGVRMGAFSAPLAGLLPGHTYYYRCYATNSAGQAWASSTASFTTLTAIDYYVNDADRAGDVYCSAVGNDANDGRAASRPKASIQSILDAYALNPNDAIWIDTGVYNLAATITIGDDVGTAGNAVLLVGSTNAAGTVLNRGLLTADAISMTRSGAGYVRFKNLQITGCQNGIKVLGTSGDPCRGVEVINCRVYDTRTSGNGVNLKFCTQYAVRGSSFRSTGTSGVALDYCTTGDVTANTACSNVYYGVWVLRSNNARIVGNRCFGGINPLSCGIVLGSSSGQAVVSSNTCYRNGDDGIVVDSAGGVVADNVCYENQRDGLHLSGAGLSISNNVATLNANYGLWARGAGGHAIAHNRFHANTNYNAYVSDAGSIVSLEHNTVYGGKGLFLSAPASARLKHNVVWATGSGAAAVTVGAPPAEPEAFLSDYNDLYATDGAGIADWGGSACTNLAEWQALTGLDAHSLSVDPVFVAAQGGDLHLQSNAGSYHGGTWQPDAGNSPCIDAGDPWAEYAAEPSFNGLRVNLGAYGGTREASLTYYIGMFYPVTIATNPAAAGTVEIWPRASAYPSTREITIWATVTNANYTWKEWTGSLGGTSQTNRFFVTDAMEITAVFAPRESNSYGVPDWWFTLYGIESSDAGAEADPDGDGHANWREFYAGTVPTNSSSVLRWQETGLEPNGRRSLVFDSVTGRQYLVTGAASPGLGWTPLSYSLAPEGAWLTDPIAGSGGPINLYVSPAGTSAVYRVELQ